jgi:pimeloyl-ACP methyl ester carboxylesterase
MSTAVTRSPFRSAGERLQAGRLVQPDHQPHALIVAVPGGTYTGSYFDADPAHGFAGYAASRGYAVLALDTLGTGDSERPANGDEITPELAASAVAQATAEAASRLGVSTVIGCGHSLGGWLVLRAQQLTRCFTGVALLGYSPGWTSLPGAAGLSDNEVLARFQAIDQELWSGSYIPFPRHDAVGDYAEVPRGLALAFGLPDRASPAAATLDVPLFLGFGEDEPFRPRTERPAYPVCPEVTGFVLPGSGHCHYGSPHQTQLHAEMLAWIRTIRPVDDEHDE